LPETYLLSYDTTKKLGTYFVKPVIGSVGNGVAKKTKPMKTALNRRFLVQKAIPLATYQGAPYDLRVAVQKNGEGKWQVTGVVAKVAKHHPYLTNLAKGGYAVRWEKVAKRAVLEKVEHVALEAAKTLEQKYAQIADLGLDIGIDANGHPWIIEVNVRDQRYSFYKGGDIQTFYALYHTPLAYAKWILKEKNDGKQSDLR
jgi:glutathione synthase/RimK-type ligase-like ATP-grasp enzyme